MRGRQARYGWDAGVRPRVPAARFDDPTISSVAAKHSASPAQIALAWLLHKDQHVLLLPGTSSVAHLEQNMAAARVALDDDDLAALDDVARPQSLNGPAVGIGRGVP